MYMRILLFFSVGETDVTLITQGVFAGTDGHRGDTSPAVYYLAVRQFGITKTPANPTGVLQSRISHILNDNFHFLRLSNLEPPS